MRHKIFIAMIIIIALSIMFVSVVHGADQYEKQESNLQRCTAIEDPVQLL